VHRKGVPAIDDSDWVTRQSNSFHPHIHPVG